MTSQTEINATNKWLKETYGCELDGRQKFRIVWSEGLTEIRVGVHNVYHNGIFVRQTQGAKEVRKYSYVKDRFILEQLLYYRNPEVLRSELGSYEPVWVFRDKDGNYLDPIRQACSVIINSLFNRDKKSPGDILREDEEVKKSEIQYNLDVIQNNSPYLATMMHNKEAKFQDSTKEMKDEIDSGKSSSLPTEGS